MTLTIYKYPLYAPQTDVEMPVGAEILHVGNQDAIPCIWARVLVEDGPTEVRSFVWVGTGHPVAEGLRYVGTFVGTVYVWHVHELL